MIWYSPVAGALFAPCSGSGCGKEGKEERYYYTFDSLMLASHYSVILYFSDTSTGLVETVISYTIIILEDLVMTPGRIHDIWISWACLQGEAQSNFVTPLRKATIQDNLC